MDWGNGVYFRGPPNVLMMLMERIMNMLVNVLGAWSVDILELAAAILAEEHAARPVGVIAGGSSYNFGFAQKWRYPKIVFFHRYQ